MGWMGDKMNCWNGCSRPGWQRLTDSRDRWRWWGGRFGWWGEPVLCFGSPSATAGRAVLTQIKVIQPGGGSPQSGGVA